MKDADAGAALILSGTKTLTFSPVWDYPDGKIPFEGVLAVLLDGARVRIMPFGSITDEMACAYCEGKRTVDWRRRVMGRFYQDSAARHGALLTDDTPHSWEWFEVAHRL